MKTFMEMVWVLLFSVSIVLLIVYALFGLGGMYPLFAVTGIGGLVGLFGSAIIRAAFGLD